MEVLHDVNLDVSPGECVGIEGRNGSGKSTLLLLAGGAIKASRGRVVRHTDEHGVLYLPQSPERLFFAETVMEEVAFGLERRGASRDVAKEKARAALAHASLDPDQFAARSPFEISFGEMRRVAFAIAFALEPQLLLLDEPASCLDEAGNAVLDDLVALSVNGEPPCWWRRTTTCARAVSIALSRWVTPPNGQKPARLTPETGPASIGRQTPQGGSVDYSTFGAVGRLLAVASMFVTVINNFWRHGDIDLTGRFANMRKIYGRAAIIGVVLAAVTRINILAMLRTAPALIRTWASTAWTSSTTSSASW